MTHKVRTVGSCYTLFSSLLVLALSACVAPESGSPEDLNRAEAVSRGALSQRLATSGARINAEFDLATKRRVLDEESITHVRFQQTHQGVPVEGGEAIVHLRDDGSVFAVTDDLVPDLADVDVTPTLSAGQATDVAISAHGCAECLTAAPEAELVVLRQNGRDLLAYRVQLRQEDNTDKTSLPVYLIDAHTGQAVWSYDNLQTATGSGSSLYSGTVSVTTYLSGTTYYLEDTTKKLGTFDNRNTTGSTYRFTDTDNSWVGSTQRAGVDAHYGAGKTYDYYLNTHGRRGIDGNAGPAYYTSIDGVTGLVSSKVHYSTNYNNAFWNGSYMTYGDGDGSTFSPLVTLDICGHEMTHGVTERTAGLVYSGESGALNESMSDVLGSMVERYAQGETSNTWKIGEQAYTPATAGDALRYMNNTHAGGDPDHYSERYTGTSDNGGVHTNSGIGNFAFYLVAKGGTHHLGGSMTGIGTDAAAKIWYRALTSYMTSSTNFHGARVATLNAAAALYGSGSTNYNAVAQAWTLCGVN
jgi:Zn-dependent metalloprotease